MDKQEQAQRFAEILLKTTHANHGHLGILELENISETAYSLADYMQAEADKREEEKALRDAESHKTFMDMLNQKEQNYHDELVSIGLEDWQPDWSQAPEWANWWAMDKDSSANFFRNKPEITNGNGWGFGGVMQSNNSHKYAGNWQDSLRKRPQGE